MPSAANLRGVSASLMHTNIRLSFDQTLENATGVGAPPWSQPIDELVIDLVEKTVFGVVTGALADATISPSPGSSAKRAALGDRLKGHA